MTEFTAIRVIVFDFDGTLVDSNAGKRQAFYELFEDTPRWRTAIDRTLQDHGEASRYVILRKILKAGGEVEDHELENTVEELADRYNRLALAAASNCPERPAASHALEKLSNTYKLYVSSGTPTEPLQSLIAQRGWAHHFQGVFGYPDAKTRTLEAIAAREGCEWGEMLVVGDGLSDQNSANDVGCVFFQVVDDNAIPELVEVLQ